MKKNASTGRSSPGKAKPAWDVKAHFKRHLEVEYEETRTCETSGCHDHGICRCSKIDGVKIISLEGVGPECFTLRKLHVDSGRYRLYTPTEIELYCIQRLMVSFGCYDRAKYDISVDNGYYGEEVSDVRPEGNAELLKSVTAMLALQDSHEQIMHCLSKEYGYIAPLIKYSLQARVVDRKLSHVEPSRGALMLKRQDSYCYELDENSIIGILFDGLLVDGNHRFSYALGKKGAEHSGRFIQLY